MVTYLVCGSCGAEYDSRGAASVATVASRRDDGWIAISCRDCGHAEKAAQQVWCALSIGERVELCRRDGVSIFAARHQYIPQDDSGRIFEYCRPEE